MYLNHVNSRTIGTVIIPHAKTIKLQIYKIPENPENGKTH